MHPNCNPTCKNHIAQAQTLVPVDIHITALPTSASDIYMEGHETHPRKHASNATITLTEQSIQADNGVCHNGWNSSRVDEITRKETIKMTRSLLFVVSYIMRYATVFFDSVFVLVGA
jgi:hypothetical protein